MINTSYLKKSVADAIEEDVGSGDITAGLIPIGKTSQAEIITREQAIICGTAWVDEVYRQLDPTISITWLVEDSHATSPGEVLCQLEGSARALLTGERTALNFLQTLSGTATTTRRFVDILQGSTTQLLDTRKTVPGLRHAQKYAVRCGGGQNHRMGLFDAFLIKENHIIACGSIKSAIVLARKQYPNKTLEVEVENLSEFQEAVDAGADIIMLDNFDIALMSQAVQLNAYRSKLEVSGNVNEERLKEIANTGVDYVSVGALTKHVRAIDLSMRHVG